MPSCSCEVRRLEYLAADSTKSVLAMKEIWTSDEPEFHREFVNFEKMWSYPKPIQPQKIAALKRQAQEAGRDLASISISTFGTPPDPDLMQRMEAAGVDRVVFGLPSEKRDTVLPIIDECTRLIGSLLESNWSPSTSRQAGRTQGTPGTANDWC